MLPLRLVLKFHPLIRNLNVTSRSKVLAVPFNSINQHNVVNNIKPIQIECVRHYAKGKQKEKARNKGVKFATYKLSDEKLNEMCNLEKFRNKFDKTIDTMQDDFVKQLSLRSTTGSLEQIKVKAKGAVHELQDIAQILRKNPKTIVINMASFPDLIPAALQALTKSGLNVNPQQEGTTIYVPVPKVTREHREGLAKNAKALFIKYRDQIKNIQNEMLRRVTDNTELSQDDLHAAKHQLTEFANEYIKKAETIYERKEKELLSNS